MIISAGIIPLLMDSFNSNNFKMASKWVSMLDQVLFNFDCLPIFFGLKGIELLVTKIDTAVQNCLAYKEFNTEEILDNQLDLRVQEKYRELLGFLPFIRSLLKLMLHLMQNSGGSDGMRNLIDSSLPKTLIVIFDYSFLFNHFYGIGINVLT